MNAGWHRALGFALTGADLPLGVQEVPEPERLVSQLAEQGWDAARIGEVARARVASEQPWPFPVPDAVRAGLGAAQLHAALLSARTALGLEVLEVRRPARPRALTADERRLLADLPPHY